MDNTGVTLMSLEVIVFVIISGELVAAKFKFVQ